MTDSPHRFVWRSMVSVLIALSFLALIGSGLALFVSPPGRIANWTQWTLTGLSKSQWGAMHVWFGLLFVAGSVFHLVFNWRLLMAYFKNRATRRFGLRREWVAALAVCGVVSAGVVAGVPPFTSLMDWNERIKNAWDDPASRAPVPHAELLLLAEVAKAAGVDFVTASNRLAAHGVTNIAAAAVLKDIAAQNGREVRQVYAWIAAERGPGSEGQSHRGGADSRAAGTGAGGQRGAGGGVGWKTLEQYCGDEGLDLAATIALLRERGFKIEPGQTLRDLARANNQSTPYELLGIVNSSRGGDTNAPPRPSP